MDIKEIKKYFKMFPKGIAINFCWSISGVLLINIILQFFVYPKWNNELGSMAYGNVLYLMSWINILSISLGISSNYARMKESVFRETHNSPYILIMMIGSFLFLLLIILLNIIGAISLTLVEGFFFWGLMCLMMWRYYSEVEFRLHINYKGLFLFYLMISIGYLFGTRLFQYTKFWFFSLVVGELVGIGYVAKVGNVLKWDSKVNVEALYPTLKIIIYLFLSEFLSTLIFNSDRLLLKRISGEAVTYYYLASLLGKTVSFISTPLNSIIAGYLSKFKGLMNRKILALSILGSVIVVILGTIGCTLCSHFVISFLYPDNYSIVKSKFLVANMAQVVYFTGNIVLVILLRFGKPFYNITINAIYAVLFCCACIPAVLNANFDAFCLAVLFVNGIRLIMTYCFMAYQSFRDEKKTSLR